jgi:peptide deformylase
MPALKIYTYGEPILRKVAKPIRDINDSIQKLAKDMMATIEAAEGVGLAATQVGILERIIVVNPKEGRVPFTLINPEIISRQGEEILEEGCLSIPGLREKVKRSHRLLVKGIDLNGKEIRLEGEGLVARILEHELDHLNGILFIDRLSLIKRGLLRPKLMAIARNRNGRGGCV